MTQDSLEQNSKKTVRQKKSLEEEIALQREKLKRLEDKHREQQRKWREKNQKSVLDLVRSEKLDLVEIEKWQEILPNLKSLLASESA